MAEKTETPVAAEPAATARPLATGTLLILALLWLTATMWVTRALIAGSISVPAVVISSAALALPSVIAATLLAGAAAGLAATTRFAAGRPVLWRAAIGAAAGAAVGAVTTGAILFTFGANAAIAVIAATVGVAGLLAGAAGALPGPVVAAAVASTLSVFVIGALRDYYQTPLKSALGAGSTVASQYDAGRWLFLLSGVVSGLVAGAIGYRMLRLRDGVRSWPWYLLVGASAGIIGLAGEGLTRLGGASLLRIAGGFSTADRAYLDYLAAGRIEGALLIGFIGGIAAMILIGRTMRRPS